MPWLATVNHLDAVSPGQGLAVAPSGVTTTAPTATLKVSGGLLDRGNAWPPTSSPNRLSVADPGDPVL